MDAQRPAPVFSLKRRLVVSLGLAVLLFWIGATAGAGLIVRHEINEVFDSALQEVAQRVLPLAYAEILTRETDDAPSQRLPDTGRHEEYITYVVRDSDGRLLLQSHDADGARFPAGLPAGFADRNGERYYSESVVSGTIIVTAKERSGHRAGALRKAMMALAWPLLLLLPGVMLVTLWSVARSVRPVADLGTAIVSRGDGNLVAIDPAGLPAEVMPVGLAVNTLIERLRRMLAGERSFTANAAHELRTPVAGALAQTQRLIAECADEATCRRAGEIEAALRRLARLTEKLLQLAKADGGALTTDCAQDLRPVLQIVLADQPGSERIERTLADQPVLSRVDVDVFAIALRNLVENALKHGRPDTPVGVDLQASGSLTVSNLGPVMSQAEFERVCQRFQRGSTLEDGAGLGLAIVSAIAQGVGGTLSMRSPLAGHPDGVAVTLSFPTSREPASAPEMNTGITNS